MSDPIVHNITDAVTPENPETMDKTKKIAAAVLVTAGVVLVVASQIQRFTRRKNVELIVADKPEDTTDSTS